MEIQKNLDQKIEEIFKRVGIWERVKKKLNVYTYPVVVDSDRILCIDESGLTHVKESLNTLEEQIKRRLITAGLSERAMNKTFNNFYSRNDKVKDMRDMVIEYYSRFDQIKREDVNSIALLGQSGSGKTHLGYALINNVVRNKNIEVKYISYLEEITELRQNIMKGQLYQQQIKPYKETELLVIDDMFKGGYTSLDIKILIELINYRYNKNLPVMIISELALKEIFTIDLSLGGKIKEMTEENIFEIKGSENNYRLKDK